MRLLVDMNLSPRWVVERRNAGHEAVHWSEIGDPAAADAVIMGVARDFRLHGRYPPDYPTWTTSHGPLSNRADYTADLLRNS